MSIILKELCKYNYKYFKQRRFLGGKTNIFKQNDIEQIIKISKTAKGSAKILDLIEEENNLKFNKFVGELIFSHFGRKIFNKVYPKMAENDKLKILNKLALNKKIFNDSEALICLLKNIDDILNCHFDEIDDRKINKNVVKNLFFENSKNYRKSCTEKIFIDKMDFYEIDKNEYLRNEIERRILGKKFCENFNNCFLIFKFCKIAKISDLHLKLINKILMEMDDIVVSFDGQDFLLTLLPLLNESQKNEILLKIIKIAPKLMRIEHNSDFIINLAEISKNGQKDKLFNKIVKNMEESFYYPHFRTNFIKYIKSIEMSEKNIKNLHNEMKELYIFYCYNDKLNSLIITLLELAEKKKFTAKILDFLWPEMKTLSSTIFHKNIAAKIMKAALSSDKYKNKFQIKKENKMDKFQLNFTKIGKFVDSDNYEKYIEQLDQSQMSEYINKSFEVNGEDVLRNQNSSKLLSKMIEINGIDDKILKTLEKDIVKFSKIDYFYIPLSTMIKTNKDFRKNILKAIFQNFLEICEDQKGLNFLEKIGILLTNTELINLHKEIGHYLEILMQSKDIEYAIKKITNGSGTFIRNLFKVK